MFLLRAFWGATALAALASFPAAAQDGPPRGVGGPRAGGFSMLQAADANGDQLIERAEFDALATETFDWRDRNGDGVLDIADMSPAVRRLAERRDAEGADGGPRRRGRFGLDADENGQITRAEFAAGEAEVFARLDVDSDGVITSAELNDRNEARRERRRWWRAR